MSALKILFWLAGLTLIGWFASELANHPGRVQLMWQDTLVEMSLVLLLLLVTAFVAILMGILRICVWVVTTPRRWSVHASEKRHEQGLQALTEAFAAMALSDYHFARKQTERAQKLLDGSPLSLMFSAQLARLEGDEVKTRHYLEQMLANPQTEFVATRGLVETYRRREDWRKATEQAEKALTLRPKDKWVATTLIDLYSRQKRWQEALQVAEKARKKSVISAQEYNRFWAIIHFEHGRKLVEAKEWHNAKTFLQLSHKKSPEFIPAAVLLAKTHHAEGKAEQGFKVLQQTWKLAPHPDLATTLHLIFGDEIANKRFKRVEKLVSARMEHVESQIALGDAALQANDLSQARHLFNLAYAQEESVRVCRLMAELCQRDAASSADATTWLMKASNAKADPTWICQNCGNTEPHWDSHCAQCSSFDSFAWESKPLSYVPLTGATGSPEAAAA